MMIITKLYYYGLAESKDNLKIFDGSKSWLYLIITSITKRINKVLKVKRWNGTLGGAERFFITIMLPLILVLIGWNFIAKALLIIYTLLFSIFFIIRIKKLFKGVK